MAFEGQTGMIKLDSLALSYFEPPAFILIVDPEKGPIYSVINQQWSDGARRLSEDVVGKTAEEIFSGPLGVASYTRQLEVVRSGQKLTYDVVLPLTDRNHNVRTTLVPVLDSAGDVVQLVGISFDRTAELEGAAVQARAASANADIEQFISIAAHDLRAPMENIKSLADMLRDDFEDHGDGKLELIDILEAVAVKVTALISDILAHAQATDAIGRQETFDVVQMSKYIFVTLDPHSQHKLCIADQWLSSDKTAVQIALRNLYDNAIKHPDQNVVELSVTVSQINEDVVEFAVQDNGVGFNDPAVAFLDGGNLRIDSGFGLLGVRRLITARGGVIAAENLPNQKGSVIRFTVKGQIVGPPIN
jgi:signal transduction histidine kinase